MLSYEIADGGVTITDCDRAAQGDLALPTEIEGLPVTSIGDEAFNFCRTLTSITIGDNVTSIGQSAFSYCTSLTSITIPDSVISIGDSAFEFCNRLTSITIPEAFYSEAA